MVSPLFTGFGSTSRDDSNSIPSQGVRDEQQAIFHHADCYESLLCIVLTLISPFDGEEVLEHLSCRLKAYAMIAPVAGGFGVVPFEVVIMRDILLSSSLSTFPSRNAA
jgi:hypothetical protein